jgi:hypothetical protein
VADRVVELLQRVFVAPEQGVRARRPIHCVVVHDALRRDPLQLHEELLQVGSTARVARVGTQVGAVHDVRQAPNPVVADDVADLLPRIPRVLLVERARRGMLPQ